MNEMHEANRKGWDAAALAGRTDFRSDVDWRQCHHDAGFALTEQEVKWLGDISGKNACVLGSGDNHVVFALVGLGARVTSVDISQEQLNIAERRAAELGLDITFVRADVTDLSMLESESFDLVYTGGHVAVWVSDLRKYYAEATRILKGGGIFMVNEYHPFRRIWDDTKEHFEIAFPYFDKGPHQYDRAEDVPDAEPDSLPSYEYHWTVSDYVTALMEAGCELLLVDEMGDEAEAHETGPCLAGLPQCLLIVSRRKHHGE